MTKAKLFLTPALVLATVAFPLSGQAQTYEYSVLHAFAGKGSPANPRAPATVDAAGNVVSTFVIDEAGWLRIADRRSEHVACAGGRPVRSAGEMTFAVRRSGASVTWVTNQSTGYCPEPNSWPAVEAALARTGIAAPDGFSQAFDFRRCPCCGSINIIKDGVFECAVCSTPLPGVWNLDAEIAAEQGTGADRG